MPIPHGNIGVIKLSIIRRAGRDIPVHWGHLLIPADTETAVLRDW